MDRATKSYFRLWLIALLAIAVIRLLSGCATVQTQVVEISPMPPCYPFQMCMVGQVACSDDNHPVIVLREGIDSNSRPFVLAHEYTHVRQMQGDCKAVQAMYKADPNLQWAMELEAYCAEAEVRIKAGKKTAEIVAGLVNILVALYQATEEDVNCSWMHKPP